MWGEPIGWCQHAHKGCFLFFEGVGGWNSFQVPIKFPSKASSKKTINCIFKTSKLGHEDNLNYDIFEFECACSQNNSNCSWVPNYKGRLHFHMLGG